MALVGWTVSGVGVGLAYPGLYVSCTSSGSGFGATELAAAVITAEPFGLVTAYGLFAAAIAGRRRSQTAG